MSGMNWSSPHRRTTAHPTLLLQRRPRFQGAMTKHPTTGLRHGVAGRVPVIRPQFNPLGMDRGCGWSELRQQLLLTVVKPPFTALLLRDFVGDAILAWNRWDMGGIGVFRHSTDAVSCLNNYGDGSPAARVGAVTRPTQAVTTQRSVPRKDPML